MLNDINDLIDYTDKLAASVPELSTELRVGGGGLSGQELNELRGEFDLPPIYVRCLRDLCLFGVSLGYFSLWPMAARKGDFVTSFRSINEASTIGDDRLIVGMYEANPICVGVRGDVEDAVFLWTSCRPWIGTLLLSRPISKRLFYLQEICMRSPS